MIELTVDGRGVATLTLARPEKHNALSQALIDDLHGAADRIAADPAIRVVVPAAAPVASAGASSAGVSAGAASASVGI